MSDQADSVVYRFTLQPIGPTRTEAQIRADVNAAIAEAVEKYNAESAQKILSAEVEPEGPFLGIAVVAGWLFKAVAAGFAGAAGKNLFEIMVSKLEERNFDPGPLHVVPIASSSDFLPATRKTT